MKKIKTLNKLLSSLTLLSPLVGVGFNSQYQNTQKIITENNNTLNDYFSINAEPVQMGDIWVTVDNSDPTIITGYSSGNGSLVVNDKITKIENNSFSQNKNIIALDLSNATSLTSIGENAFSSCSNLTGKLVIPSSVISIIASFSNSSITSLDLSNATSLTTVGVGAFQSCSNLTGDLVIPSSVTTIGNSAFFGSSITSLDLSNATSLTSIGEESFASCKYISGDIVIPKKIDTISYYAFQSVTLNNLYLLPEVPPNFLANTWKPSISGKVYVPSQEAKDAYLKASNFDFNQDQVEIGLPPEPTPTPEPFKSNTGLILGLILGLGIPIVLAVGFGIWYLTKKKKTTVKI